MGFGANYYLLTSLPALAEPGAAPAMSPVELRARASGSSAAPLVDVILLADDVRQRQAVLAGELTDVEPAVLMSDQITGRAPLPASLGFTDHTAEQPLSDDLVWEDYWHHAALVARRRRSAFLSAWVRVEIALRNGLAGARARSLEQSGEPHRVALGLGRIEPMVERAVAAWASAPDPLAGWRSLLRIRWEWATARESAFTFSPDEVAAYAVKLVLVRDWRRTMGVSA